MTNQSDKVEEKCSHCQNGCTWCRGEDEKGSGGFWDKAGEIAEQYELQKQERDENEPVYPDERLQEMIYDALTSSYEQGVRDGVVKIQESVIKAILSAQPFNPKDPVDTRMEIENEVQKVFIQALKNN